MACEVQRKLAALQVSHDSPGASLNPTVLVHEVYLKLLDPIHAIR